MKQTLPSIDTVRQEVNKMASQHYFKRGWDREKLAEYILSRFSFVAKPSTVSDDLGTDLFCTLFINSFSYTCLK